MEKKILVGVEQLFNHRYYLYKYYALILCTMLCYSNMSLLAKLCSFRMSRISHKSMGGSLHYVHT